MAKYYIDKTILSVMFDIQDDELLEGMNLKINRLLTDTALSTMKEYMQEKGVDEVEINKLMQEDNVDDVEFEDPLVETMLFDPELIDRIEQNINTVIKVLYMKYGENLSDEKKQMIDQYIQGKNIELNLNRDKLISGVEDTWTNIILEGIKTGPEETIDVMTETVTELTEDEIIDNEESSAGLSQTPAQPGNQMPNINLGGALNNNQQPIENTPQY